MQAVQYDINDSAKKLNSNFIVFKVKDIFFENKKLSMLSPQNY